MVATKRFRLIGLILLLFILVSAPVSAIAAPPPSVPGAAPFVEGEVLLKLKSGVRASEVARAVGGTVLRSIGDGSIQVLRVRAGTVPATVQALNARPAVAFAEPNWLRQLHDAPNDSDYGLKWDLNNDGGLCDSSDCADADADMDWQEAYTSLGSNFSGSAIVAVIDTGIDAGHPDLNGKIVAGYDFLDGDSNPNDTYGHGTHVAGIALAKTNNGEGTSGVGYSPNIKVMPLRVCDENGCPTDAIVNAIYYAVDHGANVINLSLGGRFGSSAEEVAIDYAWSKGLVIAASSGNDGARKVSYPAAFANCIAVGSTNWHDTLAGYSNKGSALDVVAPGGEMSSLHDPGGIYSTMPAYDVYLTTVYGYSQNYDQLQGTSMAAPQVSGLAALLFARGVEDANGDGKTNDDIRQIIETTVDDLGPAGWDLSFGWGRINVNSAVLAAGGGGGEDNPPNVTITSPTNGDTVSGNIAVTANASDDNGVSRVEFFVDGSSIGIDSDGLDGWSATWNTTVYADAAYTVSATATDTIGQTTASDGISVTVDNGTGGAATLHVSAIDMSYSAAGPNRFVTTQVTIVDESDNPVSDATVFITTELPDGVTSSASGQTGSNGTVTFSLKSKLTGTYTSTVTNVTHATLTYDSGANAETSESITVQ